MSATQAEEGTEESPNECLISYIVCLPCGDSDSVLVMQERESLLGGVRVRRGGEAAWRVSATDGNGNWRLPSRRGCSQAPSFTTSLVEETQLYHQSRTTSQVIRHRGGATSQTLAACMNDERGLLISLESTNPRKVEQIVLHFNILLLLVRKLWSSDPRNCNENEMGAMGKGSVPC